MDRLEIATPAFEPAEGVGLLEVGECEREPDGEATRGSDDRDVPVWCEAAQGSSPGWQLLRRGANG
jgi:hypothetical protein